MGAGIDTGKRDGKVKALVSLVNLRSIAFLERVICRKQVDFSTSFFVDDRSGLQSAIKLALLLVALVRKVLSLQVDNA